MILLRPAKESNYYNLRLGEGEEEFSLHPFHKGTIQRFVGKLAPVTKEWILENELFSTALPTLPDFPMQSMAEYKEKLLEAIAFVKENHLEKIVLSRRKESRYDNLSLSKTFLNLCQAYPTAFVYLVKTEEECWMGAFSEVLGSFDHKTGIFETISLAGTLLLEETWSEKELKEHEAVTRYVKEVLETSSSPLNQSEVYSHPSGKIKHLRVDFSLKLEDEKEANRLVTELHPTPAVLGRPKALCLRALERLEPYSREYYAGYLQLKTKEKTLNYVNLRCAKFFKEGAHLFVGGGITEKSNIDKEWQETQHKSRALLDEFAQV